jgi:hypothetical protein
LVDQPITELKRCHTAAKDLNACRVIGPLGWVNFTTNEPTVAGSREQVIVD